MFDKFLIKTLPKLEDRSRDTGIGYVVFLFEYSQGRFFSEKIRVFDGDTIYRYFEVEAHSPEHNFNRIKNNLPEGVTLIYEWLKSNKRGAAIIVEATETDNHVLDYLN